MENLNSYQFTTLSDISNLSFLFNLVCTPCTLNFTLYLKKVDFNINTAQEKLKIWNECMSDVIVKDFVNEYNHIIEEKVELQQKRTFSENKEKIAKDIFENRTS